MFERIFRVEKTIFVILGFILNHDHHRPSKNTQARRTSSNASSVEKTIAHRHYRTTYF